ncbi:MAG TPA: hypothetical protein VNE58_08500 [Casimicrobiaceae bacterium]|nr:hypothetical protein [Casimicrobiaceae bacterium]
MITLAASMLDVPNLTNGAASIGETLFLAIGALVVTFVIYGLTKHRQA